MSWILTQVGRKSPRFRRGSPVAARNSGRDVNVGELEEEEKAAPMADEEESLSSLPWLWDLEGGDPVARHRWNGWRRWSESATAYRSPVEALENVTGKQVATRCRWPRTNPKRPCSPFVRLRQKLGILKLGFLFS